MKKILLINRINLAFFLRCYLGEFPLFYNLLLKSKDLKKNRIPVSKNTDICIEGYPRCANTFAVMSFETVQDKKIEIAHHCHTISQIVKAKKYNIPTIICIRNPYDAIASFAIREPNLSLNLAINYYIDFYQYVYKYQKFYLIADFNDIVKNFPKIIQKVNNKFNSKFQTKQISQLEKNLIFEQISNYVKNDTLRGSIPSVEKNKKKQEIILLLQKKYVNKMKLANKLYQLITN